MWSTAAHKNGGRPRFEFAFKGGYRGYVAAESEREQGATWSAGYLPMDVPEGHDGWLRLGHFPTKEQAQAEVVRLLEGSIRTYGPAQRGRPPLPPEERRRTVQAVLAPETIASIEAARRGNEPIGQTIDRLIADRPPKQAE